MKNFIYPLALLLFFSIGSLNAQTAPIDDNGLAIGGYDVVSYFSGTAQKGSSKIKTKHNGATYYFASADNKAKFEKAPKNYLPQFDGYCAWAVGAKETKVPINPETFDIVDGKLYLFFNGDFNGEHLNTLQPWSAETTKLLTDAHKNWDKMD